MADSLQTFIDEAAAFFESIISAVEGVFGANNPMSNAIGDLSLALKADIEAVKVVVDDVEQTLVPTKFVYDQIVSFVANVKNGILSGPMASSWEQEAMVVLKAGIPIALTALGGGGPAVMLTEEVAQKLLALL